MYYSEYLNLKADFEKKNISRPDYEKSLSVLINKIITDLQQNNINGHTKKALGIINDSRKIEIPDIIKKRFDNILLNEEEIALRKTVLKSKPRVLYCVVTSLCNIKCIMCQIIKKKWELPERAVDEIIELMPYLEIVKWQGGEVFLYKRFEELMDHAGRNNVCQEIVTNGLLLNENIITKLVKYNVDLYISAEGITKEIYESVRVGGKFETLINNLNILKRIRSEFSGNFTNLGLNVLVMKKNIEQIEFFPEFAREYGFTKLCVNAFGPDFISDENIFHYNKNIEFEKKITDIKEKLTAKCKNFGIELFDCLPCFKSERECITVSDNVVSNGANETKKSQIEDIPDDPLLCHIPWQKIFIDSDGTINPECFCDRNKSAGNIDRDKLPDVWNGKVMQEYRKVISDNSYHSRCVKNCVTGITHSKSLKNVINPNLFWWLK